MTTYIVRRLFETIPVLVGVSILVFLFIHIIPGDPAITLLGERASPENIERIREQLGLNRPLFLNFRGSEAIPLTETPILYTEPGSSEVAGEVTGEATMSVIDRQKEEWFRVTIRDGETLEGWLPSDQVHIGPFGLWVRIAERELAGLHDEPTFDSRVRQVAGPKRLVVQARESRESWVKVTAVDKQELHGWVQDEAATDEEGIITFSDERLRAFDEPLERGARRLGSVETAILTVVGPGEPGWYEVTWIKEENRTTGWILENDVRLVIRPFDSQYFIYMSRILQGDLGKTIQGNIPVASELSRRLPATMELSIVALFLAVIIGIPIGVMSAVWRNSLLDTASMMGALIGVSMPIFWLGLMLIYVFSIQWQILPMVGRLDVNSDLERVTGFLILDALLRLDFRAFGDSLRHILMPAAVLATVPVSIIARITSSSMLEVLHQDYIRTARAKGLVERLVISRHALRNALMPVVTVVGLQLGTLLSGAVLTETIFTWPGIGRWVFSAILQREYPIIQSVTLIVAFIFVMINLLVDVMYGVLNPRIRLS